MMKSQYYKSFYKLIFLFIQLFILSKPLAQLTPQIKFRSYTFSFDSSAFPIDPSNNQGIVNGLMNEGQGMVSYFINNKINLVAFPTYSNLALSPMHFSYKNNRWNLERFYENIKIGNPTYYKAIDSNRFVISENGIKNISPKPYGDIWIFQNINDSLKWSKVSKEKSNYLSVTQGDINNDGLFDIIGLQNETNSNWKDNLHAFIQNNDGSFSENRVIIASSNFLNRSSGGAVLAINISGDKYPEIIRASKEPMNSEKRYSFDILSYNTLNKQYENIYETYNSKSQGATSLKAIDVNKDNIIDFAIVANENNSAFIHIWIGNSNGEYQLGQIISFNDTLANGTIVNTNNFKDFEVADVNNDGWEDVIIHPIGFGSKFRINPNSDNGNTGEGIMLNHSIWLNEGGILKSIKKDLSIYDIRPSFMKGFYINGELKFFGFSNASNSNNIHSFQLLEATVKFCKDLIKPTFTNLVTTFCAGDSLKITVNNKTKGDTLKWYYGLKIDETNSESKVFFDSTSVFVIKTDSLGCSISSDTINLKTKSQPEYKINGKESIAFNKESTLLTVKPISNRKTGIWYYNNLEISKSDTLIIKTLGSYKYIQVDSNNCSSTYAVEINKEPQIVNRLVSKYFDIKQDLKSDASIDQILIAYNSNGTDHLINTLGTSTASGAAPLHFYKINNQWTYEGVYPEATMSGGARNYDIITSQGDLAIASHGTEAYQPGPFGDLFMLKTVKEKLKWTKASKAKSFYHSVASRDITGDSLPDLVGVHMGTYGNWFEGPHIYIQNSKGEFDETRNYLDTTGFIGRDMGQGAVLLSNINGDKWPELIIAEYGFNTLFQKDFRKRFGLAIFQYDTIQKKYKFYKSLERLGIYSNPNRGTSSIKSADIDNDGDIDLITAVEGGDYHAIQFFINNGNCNFSPGQIIDATSDIYSFREFDLADVNKDGYVDLLLNPFSIGTKFRLNSQPPPSQNTRGDGIILNSSIYLNKKGRFSEYSNEINIFGIYPENAKALYSNDKLKFLCFEEYKKNNSSTDSNYSRTDFYIHEIELTICNNLIKPTFNTNKYSFCSGDSLKLSITNVNKGDTLKWYFGTKSDITNVANKTFTDSSKVFVTRTDSLGCIISSDTIQLKKYAIPSSPSLIKDSSNNLVASVNAITWYKDGVKIADTTQKIKPTTNGIYTATTTQNRCTSSFSQEYYYLTNAVANLSNGEYFKISPNPTSGELNINYKISSSRNINISVFDINGRAVLLNKKVGSGSKVNLGSISKGNYIIQVKDGAGRLISSQKLVKE